MRCSIVVGAIKCNCSCKRSHAGSLPQCSDEINLSRQFTTPHNFNFKISTATLRFSNLRDSNTIRLSQRSLAGASYPRSISPKFSNPIKQSPLSSTQEDNQWRSAYEEPVDKPQKWLQERGRGLQITSVVERVIPELVQQQPEQDQKIGRRRQIPQL